MKTYTNIRVEEVKPGKARGLARFWVSLHGGTIVILEDDVAVVINEAFPGFSLAFATPAHIVRKYVPSPPAHGYVATYVRV